MPNIFDIKNSKSKDLTDLIPTIEIGGQSDLQEHIFDERKL